MDLTKFQQLHDDTRLAGKVQVYREIQEGPALLDLGIDMRDEFGPENCRRTVAGMLVDEVRRLRAENKFLALQLEEHRAHEREAG